MIPQRLVLATANAGKAGELRALVRAWGDLEVLDLGRFPGVVLPPEGESSYAENATGKAATVAEATGIAALADDSGLEVDALGGAPGLRSARFAPSDPERIARVLGALAAAGGEPRTARFRCVVALARPGRPVVTSEGVCEGRILREPRGVGGFGYDPIFEPDGLGQSFAELPASTKDRLSHRGRAIATLGLLLMAE